jgi:hypothetical protein
VTPQVDTVAQFAGSLSPVKADGSSDMMATLPDGVGDDYVRFLSLCNGGFTQDRMFHFFGSSGITEHNILRWNEPALWKRYFGLGDDFFVVAEDCLGNQFGYTLGKRRKVIKILNLDSAQLTLAAADFASFVRCNVGENPMRHQLTDLIKRLESRDGVAFGAFQHVSSRIPACLGGDDSDLSNLEFSYSLDNLLFMGQVLDQVRHLPEGTKIRRVDFDRDTKTLKLVT